MLLGFSLQLTMLQYEFAVLNKKRLVILDDLHDVILVSRLVGDVLAVQPTCTHQRYWKGLTCYCHSRGISGVDDSSISSSFRRRDHDQRRIVQLGEIR